jgi:hypothetical protein
MADSEQSGWYVSLQQRLGTNNRIVGKIKTNVEWQQDLLALTILLCVGAVIGVVLRNWCPTR